jgi:hypothetical protein
MTYICEADREEFSPVISQIKESRRRAALCVHCGKTKAHPWYWCQAQINQIIASISDAAAGFIPREEVMSAVNRKAMEERIESQDEAGYWLT